MAEVAGLGITAGGTLGIGGDSCEELGAMPEVECDAWSHGIIVVINNVERDSATCLVLMGRITVLPCSVL